jgi:hypothetical protein
MNTSARRIFFGAALILMGGLLLAQQIFHLELHLGGLMVAVFFAIGAAVFLYVLIQRKENWWAAIPGMVLLGLAVLIAGSQFFQPFFNQFGGGIFLGFIGLAFLVVLLVKHDNWWAVIPMGVLFTLAIVAAFGSMLNGFASGSIFFMGLAVTFAAIGFMPVGRNEKWPWIPAGICGAIATMLLFTSGQFMQSFAGLIWPGLLVLLGIYLVVRTFFKKNQ